MDVRTFGRALVTSGDLDPIYLMLNSAGLSPAELQRWSLAYWMFYHAGVASRITEAGSSSFWQAVQQAQDEKWPRGTERRHFKGAQSQKAIDSLRMRFTYAERATLWAATGEYEGGSPPYRTQAFTAVRDRVMSWRGFGPWIAFKVADMVDAVLGVPVDFSEARPYLFDDPVKGAVWVAIQELPGLVGHPTLLSEEGTEQLQHIHDGLSLHERHQLLYQVLPLLQESFKDLACPHRPERGLQLQEYETILCKYKSHLNGKYPVGKDTAEILHGLSDPQWGPLAHRLRTALKTVHMARAYRS